MRVRTSRSSHTAWSGAPGLACATAVDARGNVHFYYEIEPLGVYIAETFTGSNIRLYYQSGEDLEKAR
jgi:hypothetical protein